MPSRPPAGLPLPPQLAGLISRLPLPVRQLLQGHAMAEGMLGMSPRQDGVALAHVRQRENDPPLLEHCLFRKPLSEPGELVETMTREMGATGLPMVAVLGLEQYSVLPADVLDVPRAELAEALRWRIKDRVDFPVEEAVLEVFDKPVARPGDKATQVYVAVAREMEVQACAQLCQSAHANLLAIDVAELALANLATLLPDDPDGVAMLYLERNQGLVQVTRKGQAFLARPMERGWEDLLRGVNGQSDASVDQLFRTDALDHVALEIQRTMDYYESHFFQSPVSSIHIAPMETNITNLRRAIADKMGMRVKEMPLREILEIPDELDDALLARCLTAIGAALRPSWEGRK